MHRDGKEGLVCATYRELYKNAERNIETLFHKNKQLEDRVHNLEDIMGLHKHNNQMAPLTFSEALKALRGGRRIRRSEWPKGVDVMVVGECLSWTGDYHSGKCGLDAVSLFAEDWEVM